MASDLRSLTLAVALAIGVLAPSTALGEPTAADVESARNLMDRGRHFYDDGDYAAALESFQGADALVGVTSTGLWVGKTLMKLGRLIEARDKLYQVSQLPPQADESEVLREARREADDLQRDLADRIPEVTFRLEGLHEGAQPTLLVDGDVVEAAVLHLPRKVDPGEHVLRATAPGYHDVEVPFVVKEASRESLTLTFERNGKPLDGPPKKGDGGAISPLVWAGIGVAGAGVIVGAITGGLSLADASDAKTLCGVEDGPCQATGPQLAEAEDLRGSSLTLAHVSTVSFAVAGVGAALMITGFIVGGGDEDEADLAVVPIVGPGSLGLFGRF